MTPSPLRLGGSRGEATCLSQFRVRRSSLPVAIHDAVDIWFCLGIQAGARSVVAVVYVIARVKTPRYRRGASTAHARVAECVSMLGYKQVAPGGGHNLSKRSATLKYSLRLISGRPDSRDDQSAV